MATVPIELLSSYTTVKHNLDAFKQRVDAILSHFANEKEGLYISRIKTPESIFEKILRGNYANPLIEMEDLLGATLILPKAPTENERHEIELVLEKRFEIIETRSNRTRQPTQFIYDDLHYILRFVDSPILVNKKLLQWKFELQIKSYLQYGWAKALHDSVYKGASESWRSSRVAAQTKAMIEMVEAVLEIGEGLLPISEEKEYKPINERNNLIQMLKEWWIGDLPTDGRRLGLFVFELLQLAKIDFNEFKSLINSERGLEIRTTASLSIQQAVTLLVVEHGKTDFINRLRSKNRFIVVTKEMETLSLQCKKVPEETRVKLEFS